MTNKWNTTLYVGVTNDLVRRVFEHKEKIDPRSFTARYHLDKLVYFEQCDDAYTAISREKQLKGGSRKDKEDLIKTTNLDWKDLVEEILA